MDVYTYIYIIIYGIYLHNPVHSMYYIMQYTKVCTKICTVSIQYSECMYMYSMYVWYVGMYIWYDVCFSSINQNLNLHLSFHSLLTHGLPFQRLLAGQSLAFARRTRHYKSLNGGLYHVFMYVQYSTYILTYLFTYLSTYLISTVLWYPVNSDYPKSNPC